MAAGELQGLAMRLHDELRRSMDRPWMHGAARGNFYLLCLIVLLFIIIIVVVIVIILYYYWSHL
jgi:uncharacterized membrane protein